MPPRKIVGQCDTATFRDIVHLVNTLNTPEQSDFSTLSKKHQRALIVVLALLKAGISLKDIYKIREILFWDDGGWTFKFSHDAAGRALRIKLDTPAVSVAITKVLEALKKEVNDANL
jgi:hypothetical protein